MEQEKNEKVIAMYQAVWELIDEGCDIHKVKVSDITSRAGIGKGTAYEYFKSKDELLTKAMQYDYQRYCRSLECRLKEQQSFEEAFYTCFSWLEENTSHRRFAMQFFKEHKGTLEQEDPPPCDWKQYERTVGKLIELGKKEGLIRKELSFHLAALQVIAQIFGYFIYQESGQYQDKEELCQAREFFYENLVKSLR